MTYKSKDTTGPAPATKSAEPTKTDPHANIESRISNLEVTMRKVMQFSEKFGARDLDGDGKIGCVRPAVLVGIVAVFVAFTAFAAENEAIRYKAQSGNDAVITIEADDAEDDNDELQIGIKNSDNSMYISIGGTELLTLSTAGALATTSLDAGSTNYSGGVTADTEMTLTDSDGIATISAIGFTASDARLILDADVGTDGVDTWTIESEATGNDLSVMNGTTEVLNLTSGGNLQIDGDLIVSGSDIESGAATMRIGMSEATRVEIADTLVVTDIEGPLHATEFVLSDEVDSLTATALLIGKATATSVEIGDTAVTTEIKGPLTVLGSTGAGLDAAGATALFIGETTATSVSIGKASGDTTILGPLNVLAATTKGIDTTGAGALHIGEDVATTVVLGQSDADTIILGGLTVLEGTGEGIDTTGAGVLFIGEATATGVSIGKSTIDTTILGPLNILEGAAKGIDTTGAGALEIGGTVATSVDIGSVATATDIDLISDGGTLSVGKTTAAATMTALTTATAIFMGADAASPANTLFDTTGAGAIDVGSADVTDIQLVTDGGTLDVGTTASAVTLTALTTATATFVGADASSPANTALDTTGAGSITIGSADVTEVSLDGDIITTTSPFQMAAIATTTESGATATLDSDDYGTIVMCTQAGGVTLTLPANGAPAGTWIDVMQGNPADNTTEITVEAATADTLIGPNDVDLDSVTFEAGSRINGYARFISNGSFWMVQNLGGTTLTYTD